MMAAKGLAFRLELLEAVNGKLPYLLRAQREKEYLEMLGNADRRTQTEAVRILSTIGGEKRYSSAASKDAHGLAREVILSYLEYEQIVHLIRDMSLVYLVSQFESFLQLMISITLQKTPGPIMEKSITLKQLTGCKSIKEAKRQIIEKEIHDVKLTSPDEADDYFSRKFGVRLSALPSWSDFKERFYRRHVLIHRLGVPDQKYLVKTGRKRVRELGVSKNYLATSVKLFSVTARRIARQLERRFGSEWPKDYL
jgi:hypothetical protein